MENKTRKTESLDQIIFRDRNKAYGAYFLRKAYKKGMTKAIFIGITFFLLIISIPLIANYLGGRKKVIKPEMDMVRIIKLKEDDKEDPVEQKLKRDEVREIIKKAEFKLEIVKPNEADTGNFLMDDLNARKLNNSIDTVISDTAFVFKGPSKEIEFTHDSIYHFVEENPEFPGGDNMFFKFLGENLHYPPVAVTYEIQGIVNVGFVVEKDGSLTNVRAVTKIGAGCDEEAVRVIKLMKNWIPGKQNGQVVRVEMVLPVRFQLLN